ncbi:MAG: gamma-glutamyltransferase, partial [Polyangiaceae bacterium]
MAFIVVVNFARRYGSVLQCRIAVAGFLLLPFTASGHTAAAFDDDGGERWLAEGRQGIVIGLTGRQSVHAGLEALKDGGNAADAALTTAMVQVVEMGGSVVSFAGILSMTYYEADTGKVHFLNACYNTPLEEKDPLSIPAFDLTSLKGTPSGRTALVPGFMAGVRAAHTRFGVLPFARLFEPSIVLAEDGFEIDPLLATYIALRKNVLERLPETRRIFTKPDGSLYGQGDMFRQPDLAKTLKSVATKGPQYLAAGDWGRQFVEAVQRDGGVITVEDLEKYRPTWEAPLETTYGDARVFAPGASSTGGADVIESLNLLELSNIARLGPPTGSGAS